MNKIYIPDFIQYDNEEFLEALSAKRDFQYHWTSLFEGKFLSSDTLEDDKIQQLFSMIEDRIDQIKAEKEIERLKDAVDSLVKAQTITKGYEGNGRW